LESERFDKKRITCNSTAVMNASRKPALAFVAYWTHTDLFAVHLFSVYKNKIVRKKDTFGDLRRSSGSCTEHAPVHAEKGPGGVLVSPDLNQA
jgi:hypothetical protein